MDVDTLIEQSTPSEQFLGEIAEAQEVLELLVLHVFGDEYVLTTQGSCAQDLVVPSSDMDVVINVKSEPLLSKKRQVAVLETLNEKLIEMRDEFEDLRVKQRILQARIPIIRLLFRKRLLIDVSAGDKMRGRPDRVVHNLLSHGAGSKLLCRTIKMWAASHSLNVTVAGGLSSFAWVLLCIFYLQTHWGLPLFKSMEVWGNESEQPTNVKQQVTGFFEWMDTTFAGAHNCHSIDVMNGTITEASNGEPLHIKVPMLPNDNAARCLRPDRWRKLILPNIRRTREQLSAESFPKRKTDRSYPCVCGMVFYKPRIFKRHKCSMNTRSSENTEREPKRRRISKPTEEIMEEEILEEGKQFVGDDNPWTVLMEQNDANISKPSTRAFVWKSLDSDSSSEEPTHFWDSLEDPDDLRGERNATRNANLETEVRKRRRKLRKTKDKDFRAKKKLKKR